LKGEVMLQLTSHMKIYAIREPISFHTRFDGTAAVCRNIYHFDPYSGALFVFINRCRTMIRCYLFDGMGEWLCDYRIAKGSFRHWIKSEDPLIVIQPHILHLLLRGVNTNGVITPPEWKKLT